MIGTIRRERLDYLIPLNERNLKLIGKEYVTHYNRGRPYSSLGPGIPDHLKPKSPPASIDINSQPGIGPPEPLCRAILAFTRVDFVLDSSLEAVDVGEESVLKEAQALGFDEEDQHRIGISVRECMVNAVVHGNAYNARKKVHLGVNRTEKGLEILIGDEGDHFDPNLLPDPTESDNLLRSSGRGLLLMRAFMDEVDVCPRQPQGTEVRLVKYTPKG